MSFIAITYGYNQYSIFNTNVSTFPLLDNIVTTCVDDMLQLLNSKLPIWEEQINNYNQEEDQLKKSIKKLETDKLKDDDKTTENTRPKETSSPKNTKDSKILKDNNNKNKRNTKPSSN
jgi:hypothetical protein